MISRSIFDPGNPNVERSGSTLTPADGRTISKMPEDVIDGYIDEEENAEFGRDAVGFDNGGQPVEASGVESQAGDEDVPFAQQLGDEDNGTGQQEWFNNPEPPPQRRPGN